MPSRQLLAVLALVGLTCFAGAQELAATTTNTTATKPAVESTRASDDEETPRPTRTLVRSTATPSPTPAPKKPSLMQRLFGGKPTPTATPAPATPRPRRFIRRPVVDDDDDHKKDTEPKPAAAKPEASKPDATAPAEKPEETPPKPDPTTPPTPEEKPEKPGPTEPPAPEAPHKVPGRHGKGHNAPAATPVSKTTAKQQEAMAQAIASGDPEAIEKAKYDELKARAASDTHIQELREKADNATTDDDGRKALRAYNQALFQKMRGLDSSLEPRIDRMEKAVMLQLEKKD